MPSSVAADRILTVSTGVSSVRRVAGVSPRCAFSTMPTRSKEVGLSPRYCSGADWFEHDDRAPVDRDVVCVEPPCDLVVAGAEPPALHEQELAPSKVVAVELSDALTCVDWEGVFEVQRADGDFRFSGVAREDDRPARPCHGVRVRHRFWEREWNLKVGRS